MVKRYGGDPIYLFQQVGGLECKPVTGEVTYGLERLAMYIQGVDSVYDLVWSDGLGKPLTVMCSIKTRSGTIHVQLEYGITDFLFYCFDQYEKEAKKLIRIRTSVLPRAYERILKAAHSFNIVRCT